MLIFLQQRDTQEADIIISERSMKEPRFADKNRTNNAPKSHVSCDFWGHLMCAWRRTFLTGASPESAR